VAFTKVLPMYQIYHTWIHPLHHSHLSPTPIPGTVSTGIIFPFTYMYTQYLYHIHLPTPFPHLLPTPTGTNTTDRTCSALLFSNFAKEKKWHFCLFKIATQGISLWHFHVYITMHEVLAFLTLSVLQREVSPDVCSHRSPHLESQAMFKTGLACWTNS
jgi:hypothetical protein